MYLCLGTIFQIGKSKYSKVNLNRADSIILALEKKPRFLNFQTWNCSYLSYYNITDTKINPKKWLLTNHQIILRPFWGHFEVIYILDCSPKPVLTRTNDKWLNLKRAKFEKNFIMDDGCLIVLFDSIFGLIEMSYIMISEPWIQIRCHFSCIT